MSDLQRRARHPPACCSTSSSRCGWSQETDAPHVLLAWLFGTNTVMAVFLQVAAARGVVDVAGSLRAQYRGARLLRALLRHRAGHPRHRRLGDHRAGVDRPRHRDRRRAVPVRRQWGLQAGAVRPGAAAGSTRASPSSATRSARVGARAYTYLAMEWGTPGWIVIAGIVVVAALGIGPSSYAAERYLARNRVAAAAGPAPG